MRFTIKLADIPIGVETIHERCFQQCGEYLTEEEPWIQVRTDLSDIEAERDVSEKQAGSDDYLETLAVYRQIAEKMIGENVLLFHGSAVAADGKGYLFMADSGTGKSTHTRIWREVLPRHGHEVFMINDDKPLLKLTEDAVLACGTPWNGKHRLGTNTMVPLAGICLLNRGKENRIRRADSRESFPWLMQYCYRPSEKDAVMATIRLLDEIARRVPVYGLYCNMEPDAALVSFEGMRRDD